MKAKKSSKNPLWIFAFFLFYIMYLIFINQNFQKLILNLIVLFFLLIFYFISKIDKKYLIIPIFFIGTLIIFKILIFIIKFDYFKLLNINERYLSYFFNDLFFYLNFKDIIFYFNSFIYSFLIGKIFNELIKDYGIINETYKLESNIILGNKNYLKLIIFPKFFIEIFYDEMKLYSEKIKRIKKLKRYNNNDKIKVIKKDYTKIVKLINIIINILKNIIKKTYGMWINI